MIKISFSRKVTKRSKKFEFFKMSSNIENSDLSETHPFLMNHLPDFFKKKCEAELNESPENKVKGLLKLKEMAQNHRLLCGIHFVDDYLLHFLRNRKYDVPRAFKHIVKYVNLVNSHSFMFQKVDIGKYYRDPSGLFFTPLPGRCPDGCTIVLFEFGKWDPDVMPVDEFKPLATTLFCQSIRDPMAQVNGYKIIFDFTDTSLKHLKCFTPQNLYLFYHGVMECLPGRQKQIHVVDNTIIAKVAYTIFRGFATQKLRKRIILNSSSGDLLEHFPPSVLPVKYGGVLTDYHMEDWWRDANEQQAKSTYTQRNYY